MKFKNFLGWVLAIIVIASIVWPAKVLVTDADQEFLVVMHLIVMVVVLATATLYLRSGRFTKSEMECKSCSPAVYDRMEERERVFYQATLILIACLVIIGGPDALTIWWKHLKPLLPL